MKINVTLALDIDIEIDVNEKCLPKELIERLNSDVVNNIQEDKECVLKELIKKENEVINKLDEAGVKYSFSDLRSYEYWI